MSNQLQAMKDQQIRIDRVDCDTMEVHFPNGVVLPITAFLAPDKETETIDPVDGGWLAFGNDEVGWGYYPVKLITEEEYRAEQERKTSEVHARGGARHEA